MTAPEAYLRNGPLTRPRRRAGLRHAAQFACCPPPEGADFAARCAPECGGTPASDKQIACCRISADSPGSSKTGVRIGSSLWSVSVV